MAKTYSFVDIPKIVNPTATAVAGGSLLANTTYYYRIYKKFNTSAGVYHYGKSIISDEFSVTTDSTNRTARITFSSPNTNGAYIIYRFTTQGTMNAYINSVTFFPKDSDYNSGGTVTFDDTGYATATGNCFLEDRDNGHGRLTIGGSTSSDKFSINDLYNADVTNGWGVILKLDENTYKINTTLVFESGQYWQDSEKTIIFADGVYGNMGNRTLGKVSGTNRTYGGCEIIVKSNYLTQLGFSSLTAYRTNFKYVYPKNNGVDITTGLGLCNIYFSTGLVQDSTCDRSRGFQPGNTCVLKNVIVSRFDVAFLTSQATFDGVRCLSGSRVWQYGINTNVTARGVYTEGTAAILLFGSGGVSNSTLNLIDSQYASPFVINSAASGFRLNDQISYNLNVVDNDGVAIDGANLKIYDKDNNLVVDTNTLSTGSIVEQVITRKYELVGGNGFQYTTVLQYPFTIIITKEGYETYKEIISPLLSVPISKTVALKTAKETLLDMDGNPYINTDKENITGEDLILIKM